MSQMFFLKYLGMSKNPLISTAGGRFHFITAQGRHLFKETTFTVSTLPRAWLEPPCPGKGGVCRRCPQRAVLVGLHYYRSLWGLKAHGTALSFVLPKTFCYSRKCFRWDEQCAVPDPGVTAFRSNQRCSASNNGRWYILQCGL